MASNCYLLIIQPIPATFPTITIPSSGVQFGAYLQTYVSGVFQNQVQVYPTNWYVNGMLYGGAANGYISSTGFYTNTNSYVPVNKYLQISATYTTTDSTALSSWTFMPTTQGIVTSPICVLNCASQVNIFLGDGRHCFIPQGTYFSLLPGQCWVAQYQETLDANMLPLNLGNSQDLTTSMFAISAQSNMVDYIVYNENTIIPNISTGGTYTRTYSIILGLCDPIEGRFQSMWEMFKVVNQVNNGFSYPPTQCTLAGGGHSMDIKSLPSNITIVKKGKNIIAEVNGEKTKLPYQEDAVVYTKNGEVLIDTLEKTFDDTETPLAILKHGDVFVLNMPQIVGELNGS